MNIESFIKQLPKAELHVHFDGTIEPEMLLLLAERNRVKLPYTSVEDIQKAHQFTTMEQFCTAFNIATQVLRSERDFYDVLWAYLAKVATQGVLHAELFFDVQTYVLRGMHAGQVIEPLYQAMVDAYAAWGMTGGLILCFLRNYPESAAFENLCQVKPFKSNIVAVGLAGDETNHSAAQFAGVFAQAKQEGYHVVAHAGEHDGPASVWQALNELHAERIDHGVLGMSDPQLVAELQKRQTPLTVCPLSNYALKVVPSLEQHPLKQMVDLGLNVSINSDDPAYFGGYIGDNYWTAYTQCGLTVEDLVQCALRSFNAAFIDNGRKTYCLEQLATYIKNLH